MAVFTSNFFVLFFYQITFQYDTNFAKNNVNLAEGLELETMNGSKSIHISKQELSFQNSDD